MNLKAIAGINPGEVAHSSAKAPLQADRWDLICYLDLFCDSKCMYSLFLGMFPSPGSSFQLEFAQRLEEPES